MQNVSHITRVKQVPELAQSELVQLEPVERKFAFRSNSYYQKLINWDDPRDPIRRLIIPHEAELDGWGELDTSNEMEYTRVPGLQHKYRDTALLLVNDICGAYCRFCFRKRLFLPENEEVIKDASAGLEYIRAHPEISNVLLTGGDPLTMTTSKLSPIIENLRAIPHVKIIRIGTKMPAFEPQRITNDRRLFELIKAASRRDEKIYMMVHFTHSTELTAEARKCIEFLQSAGALTVDQTPLIRGVNDTATELSKLLNELSFMGVSPYYVFQCRPTLGNRAYSVPLERAYEIVSEAQDHCSGLSKRARFVMSHATGKIEIVAVKDGLVYMKYHQAARTADAGRFLVVRSNERAHWFDDYVNSETSNRERGYAQPMPAL